VQSENEMKIILESWKAFMLTSALSGSSETTESSRHLFVEKVTQVQHAIQNAGDWLRPEGVKKIDDRAEKVGKKLYPYAAKKGNARKRMYWKMDAFRHLYSMAKLTQEYNRVIANFYGYGNEMVGAVRGWMGVNKKGQWNPSLHSEWFKDSANNGLGINLAKENPDMSDAQLIRLIRKKIGKGEYFVRPEPNKYQEMLYKDWRNRRKRKSKSVSAIDLALADKM